MEEIRMRFYISIISQHGKWHWYDIQKYDKGTSLCSDFMWGCQNKVRRWASGGICHRDVWTSSLLDIVRSCIQVLFVTNEPHLLLKFTHGHIWSYKKVYPNEAFHWVQPICLPCRGTFYEKRQLIGMASNVIEFSLNGRLGHLPNLSN